MNKKILTLLILFLAFAGGAMAQTINVKGTVIAKADGEPLIGAAVLVEGTTIGTITDIDGNFVLEVPEDRMIQVSFVGFASQTLKPQEVMNIELEEDNVLNAVVFVGYQTMRKADLTGAVSVADVEELAKQNENNPMKALQGRVPGMNISADGGPSGAATVRIRGVGTLNDNDPLYIIDGVPTKSGMHELNGSDIESIQVLKDAASASIYGSRAANGVIIITTKRGKEGKIKVDFDATVAASFYANRMNSLNAEEWGRAFWQANVNDGLDPNNNNLGYKFNWGYDKAGVPVLNSVKMQKYLDDNNTIPASDTDWFKETTRTGVIQNYNLAVSNGSEKGSAYMSLGYYRNDGIIKTSNFDRLSARINSEYKVVKDILTIGEHLTLNRTSETSAPGGFLENVLQYNPSFPVYNTKDEFANLTGGYSDRQNPVERLELNKNNRYQYWRIFGDAFINLQPVKNFNIRATAGIDYAQKQQRTFTLPIVNGNVANPTNAVETKQEHWMKWMANLVATYNLEIKKHRADFMLGTEFNRQNDTWFGGKRYNFSVLTPDYMWPDSGVGEKEVFGSGSGYSLVSFFGRVNYTYDDKYMFSVIVRHDGSSRFGKNNMWGTFPSASFGWRISQEPWMSGAADWLNNLKIRASWGQTGNQEISNVARYTLYVPNYGEAGFGGQSGGTSYDIEGTNGGHILSSGFMRTQLGNDNIRWETTSQTNIGLDFGFLHDKIYGSLEWYDKRTKDILVLMPGIAVMGEGSDMWINAGKMKNMGVEFNLGVRGGSGDFSYDINGNISSYQNTVVKLPDTIAARGTFGGNGVRSVVGHPMGAQVGYIYDGIVKSQEEIDNHAYQEGAGLGRIRYKDINGVDENGKLTGKPDGKITEADQDWIYSPVPDFTYGFNIYLQYKNWDFTLFCQGVAGVDVISDLKKETDLWAGVNVANLNKGKRILNAWSPNNPNSNIPALSTYNNNNETRVSTYYVENGSYLKGRTVQIGYNFPQKICDAAHMQRLRMYLSAQNFFTIRSASFTGVDPENANFGYPIPVNVTFGLNVTF
ncbi:MAG: TonB-dependent receptor [Bacteroidales bacterium]|nr:TonB-dependent receptor [Bacteroidales bacterium]